jgi:hypothetical protein
MRISSQPCLCFFRHLGYLPDATLNTRRGQKNTKTGVEERKTDMATTSRKNHADAAARKASPHKTIVPKPTSVHPFGCLQPVLFWGHMAVLFFCSMPHFSFWHFPTIKVGGQTDAVLGPNEPFSTS